MFYVYEDWTTEETPRCFYVGKGDDSRVARLKRANDRHFKIASVLGQNRRIILSTFDENEALEHEKRLIKECHTHPHDPEYNGIGCNRTTGGQGNAGRIVSLETCKKISDAKKGKHPNKVWTQAERDATSKRMSLLHKGKKLSNEHKMQISARMKRDIARHGNYTAKLTVEQVKDLKRAWQEKDLPRRSRLIGSFLSEWSKKLSVSKGTVGSIIGGQRWADVDPGADCGVEVFRS